MSTVLVAGPPCAGKSTWIRKHITSGDILLDRDRIEEALAGHAPDPCEEGYGAVVAAAFYAVLKRARQEIPNPLKPRTLWVQECAPLIYNRERYRAWNRARIVVLETPPEICNQRALVRYGADTTQLSAYLDAIEVWWSTYETDSRDEVIYYEGTTTRTTEQAA